MSTSVGRQDTAPPLSLHLTLSSLFGDLCNQSTTAPVDTLSWCLCLCSALSSKRTSIAKVWLTQRPVISVHFSDHQGWQSMVTKLTEIDPFWRRLSQPPHLSKESLSLLFNTLLDIIESLRTEWIGLIYEELLADHSLEIHTNKKKVKRKEERRVQGGDFSKILKDRRRSRGAHYTPPALCREVIVEASRLLIDRLKDLSPLERMNTLSSLSICDPAMGCGAFVMEAISWLTEELFKCELLDEPSCLVLATRCVYGVDIDPLSVEITRFRIRELTHGVTDPTDTIKCGDSLIGEGWSPVSPVRIHALPENFKPLDRFHWRTEFPLIDLSGGFDLLIGNPPFLGGRQCAAVMGDEYISSLQTAYPHSKKSADLCAFFFRRCAALCHPQGAVGLIATNTIAQGATRESGLAYLVERGYSIFSAWRRRQWPSEAAVKVSIIYLTPSPTVNLRWLNGRMVHHISSLLEANHIEVMPPKQMANRGGCAQGSIILGMGFTFDDINRHASSLDERQKLLDEDLSHEQVIKPYMGGRELNTDPFHRPHRYTIDFGERSLQEAMRWPKLVKLLRLKVAKSRQQHRNPKIRAYPWWHHWNSRASLYKRIQHKERVLLTNAQAAAHLCFAFVPTGPIFANSLNIFPEADMSTFAILQSRLHEQWAWLFSSTLGDQIRYNPTDCYETFPFPSLTDDQYQQLQDLGAQYHESRAAIMRQTTLRMQDLAGSPPEGLTATYNRFHDPQCHDEAILRLRRDHADLDQAVLDVYGWGELRLEYDWVDHFTHIRSETRPQRSKESHRRWRYTLIPSLRDELIGRLYKLSMDRAQEAIKPT